MKLGAKKLHHFYYQSVTGLILLIIYPLVIIFARGKPNLNGLNELRHFWSFLSSALSGIYFKFSYHQKIDWSRTYIICPNHTSNLDIPAMILLCRRRFVFLGKDELLDNLATRVFFKTIDIPINRESKMSAYRGFKRAAACLDDGIHVIIFPEGLIGDEYPPVLHPFKIGPFKLAIEQNIPILPVVIHNNWNLMWDDGKRSGSKPGLSRISVLPPVETEGFNLNDAEALREQVYQKMQERLAAPA